MVAVNFLIGASLIFTGLTSVGFDSELLNAELDPLAEKLSEITGIEKKDVLFEVFGELEFYFHQTDTISYSCWSTLHCYGGVNPLADPRGKGLLVHELGHRFLNGLGLRYDELKMDLGYYDNGIYVHIAGINPITGKFERTARGYPAADRPYEQHGPLSPDYNTYKEDFADWFMNWALDQFSDDPAGRLRARWMDRFVRDHLEPVEVIELVPYRELIKNRWVMR